MATKTYHHGDLRNALLDAAETVLAARGVEAFSLRACAKEAGVSHAAPAHHFRDVAGLLTALAARGFAQDAASGDQSEQQQLPEEATLDPEREDIVQIDGIERTALAPAAVTDPQEQYLAQQAMLTEAAWFVTVDCSTTLDLLHFPPQPHQVVDVTHAGERLSGPYQVIEATHVINAADHFIDFKIRANGLRAAPEAAA